ncbi:hypothetical protein ABRZ22_04775 [Bacillus pacificus]|uniref:hypothetical protein n=1 Tax=Bacillus pacificus TaxID=2026187 RepID=UPI003EE151F6
MKMRYRNYDCEIAFGMYGNGNIAMQLLGAIGTQHQGDLITTATVNLYPVSSDTVGIKNWSENRGMSQALMQANVIEPEMLYSAPTGFVEVEYYKLTEEAQGELEKQKEEQING